MNASLPLPTYSNKSKLTNRNFSPPSSSSSTFTSVLIKIKNSLLGKTKSFSSKRLLIIYLSLLLLLLLLLLHSSFSFFSSSEEEEDKEVIHYPSSPLLNSPTLPPTNWGDFIAQGHGRSSIITNTDPNYTDIGIDYFTLVGGNNYFRSRRVRGAGGEKEEEEGEEEGGREEGGREERRGNFGGESVEWSSGFINLGKFLGPIDLIKDSSSSSSATIDRRRKDKKGGEILKAHFLLEGWKYLNPEDRERTEILLTKAALDPHVFNALPLRDRVRDSPLGRNQAARKWSRVLSSLEGESIKSALEIQVGKLTRRLPVVIFGFQNCQASQATIDYFVKLKMIPAPRIVLVNLRPDSDPLRALLRRLTAHSSLPNIIIGSRSIGGNSELEGLIESGALAGMLNELGVKSYPS